MRQFSTGQVGPSGSGMGFGPMLGMALGLSGFAYLGYKINDLNSNKAAYMAEGQTFMSPIVQ